MFWRETLGVFVPCLRIKVLRVREGQAGKDEFGIARPDDGAISAILFSPDEVLCILSLVEKLVECFRDVADDDYWKRMIDVCSQKPIPLNSAVIQIRFQFLVSAVESAFHRLSIAAIGRNRSRRFP